ncbi:hypothetical protein BVRB_2g037240 [Beta vulgaris subsp. vulgaris]|nr:hypothetical protein BVRB_2g037240 [Beta vulgaris subsp. vulgaris]
MNLTPTPSSSSHPKEKKTRNPKSSISLSSPASSLARTGCFIVCDVRCLGLAARRSCACGAARKPPHHCCCCCPVPLSRVVVPLSLLFVRCYCCGGGVGAAMACRYVVGAPPSGTEALKTSSSLCSSLLS